MPLDPELTAQTTASQVIASFDGSEVATGKQFITFYLADLVKTTTLEKVLVENIVYSSLGYSKSSSAQDVDFDLAFVRNITIEGDAIINLFLGSSGANSSVTTCKLYHVAADSTETQIGSTFSTTQSFANDVRVQGIKQTIARTQFNKGETLRVSVTMAATIGAQDNHIFHDPKNRLTLSGATVPNALGSASLINLPIRI